MKAEKDFNGIINFEKRSWALKKISAERWGSFSPCPIRFVVNPYSSCSFKCPYCYIWSNKESVSSKNGFRKALDHDIVRAKKMGLDGIVVEISPSTDPFQYIEEEVGDTIFSVRKLLKAGFRVLLVTKNPEMLLKEAYIDLLKNDNVFLDVTITSLKEGIDANYFLNNNGPSADNKISAIEKIIKLGKDVRIKIEPVVPSFDGIRGQSPDELCALIERVYSIGVKMIICKTMRLNPYMPKDVIEIFLPFYKKNGKLISDNYILNTNERRLMLDPIYRKCCDLKMKFSPCYDFDVFVSNDKNVMFCDLPNEAKKRISELFNNNARVAE